MKRQRESTSSSKVCRSAWRTLAVAQMHIPAAAVARHDGEAHVQVEAHPEAVGQTGRHSSRAASSTDIKFLDLREHSPATPATDDSSARRRRASRWDMRIVLVFVFLWKLYIMLRHAGIGAVWLK